jgi:hypothetical protein
MKFWPCLQTVSMEARSRDVAEHGVPQSVLIDAAAITGPIAGAAGPALMPETIVVAQPRSACWS